MSPVVEAAVGEARVDIDAVVYERLYRGVYSLLSCGLTILTVEGGNQMGFIKIWES